MKHLSSYNPANGELLWEGFEATSEVVHTAVDNARAAQESWALTPLLERAQILKNFQQVLHNRQCQFAETIAKETGKPLWEARSEVGSMIGKVSISIKAYHERTGELYADHPNGQSITRHKPHGVLAVLGPFNFPGHLPTGHIVPALLAGNGVVFKPSELTPLVGDQMKEMWERAHLPESVLQVIQGGKKTGEALTQHAGIDGLLFTGSWSTGKQIAALLAATPQKILALEMGGNNPLLVGQISDLEAAAYQTIQSAYLSSGQRCTCARRILVPRGKQGEEFLSILQKMIETIHIGPYSEFPEPFMGPVITEGAADQLMNAQEELKALGGIPLIPMKRGEHAFVTPGLIDTTAIGERPDRELFGPLLQVIRIDSFEEGIAEANRTAYGLSAGLFSDDPVEYQTFYQKIRAGIVNWNCALTGASSAAPFGGVGQSGNHRASAYYAADYCAYPVASLEAPHLVLPDKLSPGVQRCPK